MERRLLNLSMLRSGEKQSAGNCVVGNFSGRQDPLEMAVKSRSDIIMSLIKIQAENGLGDSRTTENLDLVVLVRGEENDYS